jgi:predicted O-methyltransferase YrrM
MQDNLNAMYNNSVRFFPFWKRTNPNQVIGLLEMINYIQKNNLQANHWLELGSNIGESSTLFLGFLFIEKLECIEQALGNIQLLKEKYSDYILSKRCNLHHGLSYDLVNIFEDESFDVIYIDADHSYDSVIKDMKLYLPKIKNGGFLCGHDYDSIGWPGVVKAVDEYASIMNKQIITFKDSSWLIRKN